MGSNADAAIIDCFLSTLGSTGCTFAFAHGEELAVAGHVESDLDLIVAEHPDQVVSRIRGVLAERGLYPVARWRYDVAGAVAWFVATEDLRRGIQVDLLWDPQGSGKYGLQTTQALAAIEAGSRWPRLDDLSSGLYVLRKRLVKRQMRLAEESIRWLRSQFDSGRLRERCRVLFVGEVAADLAQVLETGRPTYRPVRVRRHRIRNTIRIVRRIVQPEGLWMHVWGSDAVSVADEIAHDLRYVRGVVFVDLTRGFLNSVSRLPAILTGVARSGLVVSAGTRPLALPHISLAAADAAPPKVAALLGDAAVR